jgi:hypothetical protein
MEQNKHVSVVSSSTLMPPLAVQCSNFNQQIIVRTLKCSGFLLDLPRPFSPVHRHLAQQQMQQQRTQVEQH